MLSEVGEAYQALSWLGKSNKFRLKIVTKGNGKAVIVGPMLHNLNRFVLQECGKGVEGV